MLLVLFRQRLRLRGFLAKFLAEAFKSAPKYNNRLTLVAPRGPKNESPVIVFSTVFSRMKHEAKLSRANFLNRHMLPSRFDAVKFIIAWKAGQKLGGQLIAFRFPKPVPISRYGRTDFYQCDLQILHRQRRSDSNRQFYPDTLLLFEFVQF